MAAFGQERPVVFPTIHQSERPLLEKADIRSGNYLASYGLVVLGGT